MVAAPNDESELAMSGTVAAGLVVLIVGLATWVISWPLARWSGRAHPFLEPGLAQEAYAQRQVRHIRIVATLLSLFGGGIFIYGLFTGH